MFEVVEVESTRVLYRNIMGQREESRAVTRECWHKLKEETKGAVGIQLKKSTDLPEDPRIRPESSICVIWIE